MFNTLPFTLTYSVHAPHPLTPPLPPPQKDKKLCGVDQAFRCTDFGNEFPYRLPCSALLGLGVPGPPHLLPCPSI